jgi:6-phosphogluconolactonase (cycloisomerase 2 family)
VVIKTRNHDDFIADLEETFDSLRKFQWKLNRLSVSLVYHQGNYSVLSLVTEGLKQSGENHRHHRHGGSGHNQGCPEAHGMHGGPKQIHLMTWRMGTNLLQAI